jgi:hypothetical protein
MLKVAGLFALRHDFIVARCVSDLQIMVRHLGIYDLNVLSAHATDGRLTVVVL